MSNLTLQPKREFDTTTVAGSTPTAGSASTGSVGLSSQSTLAPTETSSSIQIPPASSPPALPASSISPTELDQQIAAAQQEFTQLFGEGDSTALAAYQQKVGQFHQALGQYQNAMADFQQFLSKERTQNSALNEALFNAQQAQQTVLQSQLSQLFQNYSSIAGDAASLEALAQKGQLTNQADAAWQTSWDSAALQAKNEADAANKGSITAPTDFSQTVTLNTTPPVTVGTINVTFSKVNGQWEANLSGTNTFQNIASQEQQIQQGESQQLATFYQSLNLVRAALPQNALSLLGNLQRNQEQLMAALSALAGGHGNALVDFQHVSCLISSSIVTTGEDISQIALSAALAQVTAVDSETSALNKVSGLNQQNTQLEQQIQTLSNTTQNLGYASLALTGAGIVAEIAASFIPGVGGAIAMGIGALFGLGAAATGISSGVEQSEISDKEKDIAGNFRQEAGLQKTAGIASGQVQLLNNLNNGLTGAVQQYFKVLSSNSKTVMNAMRNIAHAVSG